MLTKLYEICLHGDDVLQEWRTCYISPIHKEGSNEVPRNYRGITVFCSIGRLYARVKIKLGNETEPKIMEEQEDLQWIISLHLK